MKEIFKCNKCNVELIIGKNWSISKKRSSKYECNQCHNEYNRNHRQKKKELPNFCEICGTKLKCPGNWGVKKYKENNCLCKSCVQKKQAKKQRSHKKYARKIGNTPIDQRKEK